MRTTTRRRGALLFALALALLAAPAPAGAIPPPLRDVLVVYRLAVTATDPTGNRSARRLAHMRVSR